MTSPSLAVRLVLGGVVGLGFVTPAIAATLQFAGFGTPAALLGGVVVGVVVLVVVVTRMEQVR
jgi:hypothetical protein